MGVRSRLPGAVFASALPLVLAACGVKVPLSQRYVAACPAPTAQAEPLADGALFYAALAMPDCRDGALDYAGYRFGERTYGQTGMLFDANRKKGTLIARQYAREAWLTMLRRRIAAPGNDGRVLVYIHGYNVSFKAAVEAAAKLSTAYHPGAPVVVIRWPSRGRAQNYIYDEGSLAWAQDGIDELVEQVAVMGSDVSIVAHSLGARGAIEAVDRIDSTRPDLSPRIRRLVLASADVDRDAALRPGGSVERLHRPGRRIAIYSSWRDRALRLSRDQHGYARLGSTNCADDVDEARRPLGPESNCALAAPNEGIAVIDTSQVASDGFRHSDYVDSCAVKADIAAFLGDADVFPLRRKIEREGRVGYVLDGAPAFDAEVCRSG
jgi:esterase/lipase superfamily enzyme